MKTLESVSRTYTKLPNKLTNEKTRHEVMTTSVIAEPTNHRVGPTLMFGMSASRGLKMRAKDVKKPPTAK
jgi:hypothetical protein